MKPSIHTTIGMALLGCASAQDPRGIPASTTNAPTDDGGKPSEVTKVELQFTDRSVPPRWHRSYVIDVDASHVTVHVDVYGDIIASDELTTDPSDWLALTRHASSLPRSFTVPEDGATGFSTHTLTIWDDSSPRTLEWRSTTDEQLPGVQSSIAFANAVKALVPNLEELRTTDFSPD